MRRHTIPLLLVFGFIALLIGHKATAAVYDDTSITIRPSPGSYDSSDEFVRDSIIYLFPRACVYYQTSDGARSSENEKPGKFHLESIIENAEKDGWYLGYAAPVFTITGGALTFYFNKDTGDFSCTGRRTAKIKSGVRFTNGRWLDLGNLSSSPKKTSAPTAKPATTVTKSSAKASVEQRLRRLKKLLDEGLISPDEATAKRKQILDSL